MNRASVARSTMWWPWYERACVVCDGLFHGSPPKLISWTAFPAQARAHTLPHMGQRRKIKWLWVIGTALGAWRCMGAARWLRRSTLTKAIGAPFPVATFLVSLNSSPQAAVEVLHTSQYFNGQKQLPNGHRLSTKSWGGTPLSQQRPMPTSSLGT